MVSKLWRSESSPHSNDVIGLQDLYLQLDTSNVEMIIDEISSNRIHQDPTIQEILVTEM